MMTMKACDRIRFSIHEGGDTNHPEVQQRQSHLGGETLGSVGCKFGVVHPGQVETARRC
jgi:hypothetical protein